MLAGALLAAPAQAQVTQPAPFALLELFTSEGCSTCPPADQLLSQIAANARTNGQRILTMEFHVDYWDHLGWTDPFSSAEFSARQERYVEVLRLAGVYTPQLIVNGAEGFVGSDRRRAESAITAALARPASTSLEFRVTAGATDYRVDYKVSAAPKGAVLCLALVDSNVVTRVGAGENSGRTLAHTNVVREFVSLRLGDRREGTATLRGPRTKPTSAMHVIGFVQDSRTLAVLGVAGD
jgi:hypothetical protein